MDRYNAIVSLYSLEQSNSQFQQIAHIYTHAKAKMPFSHPTTITLPKHTYKFIWWCWRSCSCWFLVDGGLRGWVHLTQSCPHKSLSPLYVNTHKFSTVQPPLRNSSVQQTLQKFFSGTENKHKINQHQVRAAISSVLPSSDKHWWWDWKSLKKTHTQREYRTMIPPLSLYILHSICGQHFGAFNNFAA